MIYLRPKGVEISEYGKILLLKLSFVLIVMALGGVSRFFILPRLQKIKTDTAQAVFKLEKWFFLVVTMELATAFIVLALAAFLTQTQPPHLRSGSARAEPLTKFAVILPSRIDHNPIEQPLAAEEAVPC